MVKVDKEQIETCGTGLDMLAEVTIGAAEVIRRVSEGEALDASALLYTIIMGAAHALEEKDGIHIRLDFIAKCIKNNEGKPNG